MNDEIELREIIHIIKKRFWILGLISILSILIAGMISYFFMTPIYQASTQLLVNNSKEEAKAPLTVSDLQFSMNIIQTYIEVITSPRILDQTIRQMNLPLTAAELRKKIEVNTVKQSQIISITVEDPDPGRAAAIANNIALTFQEQVPNIMNVDNVQILATAKVEDHPSPVKPKPVLNMVIAFVVGLMFATLLIFLLEYMDNTLKTEADVEKYLGLPVLGMVGIIEPLAPASRNTSEEKDAPVTNRSGRILEEPARKGERTIEA